MGTPVMSMMAISEPVSTMRCSSDSITTWVRCESSVPIIGSARTPSHNFTTGVDTLVAQHLLKTVTAIRLMGADAIISGVRPQIAQTIVHLGLDLQGIVTKANLADALALALKRTGVTVSKAG